MHFYLGTHEPSWLWNGLVDCSLFVSDRRLSRLKTYKPAQTDWSLDSGGFTELNLYGTWKTTPAEYIERVRRYIREIGRLKWAAPQDWMCEPIVRDKTGKSVQEHQRLTIRNFLDLNELAPDLPWIPVVQGWHVEDYQRHWEMYEQVGIHLEDKAVVGVGKQCRRQGTKEGIEILQSLQPLKLHGFGFKTTGLRMGAQYLTSADSLAWSFAARKRKIQLHNCNHRTCANCHKWALIWRSEVLGTRLQMSLF